MADHNDQHDPAEVAAGRAELEAEGRAESPRVELIFGGSGPARIEVDGEPAELITTEREGIDPYTVRLSTEDGGWMTWRPELAEFKLLRRIELYGPGGLLLLSFPFQLTDNGHYVRREPEREEETAAELAAEQLLLLPAGQPFDPAGMEAAAGQMRQVLMSTGSMTLRQADQYAAPFAQAVVGWYLRSIDPAAVAVRIHMYGPAPGASSPDLIPLADRTIPAPWVPMLIDGIPPGVSRLILEMRSGAHEDKPTVTDVHLPEASG